jgi:hypothetical protein
MKIEEGNMKTEVTLENRRGKTAVWVLTELDDTANIRS